MGRLERKEAFPTVLKVVCNKPRVNIVLNGKKIQSIPTKIRKSNVSAVFSHIKYNTEVLAKTILQENQIKGKQKEDKEGTIFL